MPRHGLFSWFEALHRALLGFPTGNCVEQPNSRQMSSFICRHPWAAAVCRMGCLPYQVSRREKSAWTGKIIRYKVCFGHSVSSLNRSLVLHVQTRFTKHIKVIFGDPVLWCPKREVHAVTTTFFQQAAVGIYTRVGVLAGRTGWTPFRETKGSDQ